MRDSTIPLPSFHRLALFALSLASIVACSGSSDSSGPKPLPIARVTLTADTAIVRATHTLVMKAKAFDPAGNEIPDVVFGWLSSNNSVATVDANGFVKTISPGQVAITASVSNLFAQFNIEVIRARIATISLSAPGAISIGKRIRIQVVAIDSAGASDRLLPLTWTSSAPNVAGINQSGELGPLVAGTTRVDASLEGITGSITITVPPLPPIRFKTISAHTSFTCGLSVDGAAFCWGGNYFGSLGTGFPPLTTAKCSFPVDCNLTPFPVDGEHVFSDLSDGLLHQCAIASDGAYCWGNGSAGNIGNGTADIVNPGPTKVQSSAEYTSINAGRLMTCGLTTLHKIDCWGQNLLGELGDPTITEMCPASNLIVAPTTCSRTPHPIASSVPFYKLTLGWFHACALTQEGAAYCWGFNGYGGTGAVATAQCAGDPCNPIPTPVVTDLRFTDISAGATFTCAISTDSRAYCWGRNDVGQLGTGSGAAQEPYPVAVNSPSSFVKIFAGDDAVCALDAAGTAFCWGFNGDGQLGIGTPKKGYEVTPVTIPGLKFTSISIGSYHACGIATDGFAYCWGSNEIGQLGTGGKTNAVIPTRVANQ